MKTAVVFLGLLALCLLGACKEIFHDTADHYVAETPLAKAARAQIGVTINYDTSYALIPYPDGDVDRGKGGGADVIVRAFRKLGVDLQQEIHQDMQAHFTRYPHMWGIDTTDHNIDHRRVPNIMTWLERHGFKLPISNDQRRYHTGDIVCWQIDDIKHIGIISNGRSEGVVPMVIHNFDSGVIESDILFTFPIIAHYRPVFRNIPQEMRDSSAVKQQAEQKDYPFVNLALEGGGVRGIAYVTVLEELDRRGILPNIKRVAGTSAGSIVALLLALNYSTSEIRTIMNTLDFTEFEDSGSITDLPSKYGYYRGEFALHLLKGFIEKKLGRDNVTFAELVELGGRELQVYATNLSSIRVAEFSLAKTPNMSIAKAVRASMSIPFFFDSMNLDEEIIVDGAVMLNYPILVFGIGELDKTIGLAFDQSHASLSEGTKVDRFGYNNPRKYIRSLFDAILSAQATIWIEDPRIRRQSILINTGEISATEFKLTDGDKQFLLDQGQLAADRFFAERE